MATITLAADSTTLTLNGTTILDFAEGDFLTLTPANALTSHTNSANGGVNINKRIDGDVYDLLFRIQKFSDSDVFMNSAINQEVPVLFNGSAKDNFTKDGTDGVETWTLQNGSITTRPTETKNNQDGNGLVEYTIRFRSAQRAL